MKNAELMHDLRMPLQLMMSCAQLLEMEIGENARAHGYVEMLMGSAREMQRMLTGGLSDCPTLSRVRSDLVARTWEAFTRCQLYAGRKNIRLDFHASTDRLEMMLDETMYSRILLNLISNALKFTPEGGNVRIAVRAMGDFAEVDVSDNGCGIAPERIDSIFSLHETSGGYGYGLYICREYAGEMGGSLAVISSPGCGSTFTLRLPVCGV